MVVRGEVSVIAMLLRGRRRFGCGRLNRKGKGNQSSETDCGRRTNLQLHPLLFWFQAWGNQMQTMSPASQIGNARSMSL